MKKPLFAKFFTAPTAEETTERINAQTFTAQKLGEVLAQHEKWLLDEDGGQQANMSNANLSGIDLKYAQLEVSDLGKPI
ncbi:hypothetical protein [Oscillibacter sp.]|uniref:hypothetical protein n=1 Tax=Oscillibacter sp. TaxID=1945593 RepID=UPI00289BCC07|nr:hypothetical protein [Oscillibacter sp.]